MTCDILRVRKKTSVEAGVFPNIIAVLPKSIAEDLQTEKGKDKDNGPDDGSQSKSKSFFIILYCKSHVVQYHSKVWSQMDGCRLSNTWFSFWFVLSKYVFFVQAPERN